MLDLEKSGKFPEKVLTKAGNLFSKVRRNPVDVKCDTGTWVTCSPLKVLSIVSIHCFDVSITVALAQIKVSVIAA